MSTEEPEMPHIGDINTQMHAALMSKEPLPVALLKEWLASIGMTYAGFAKKINVSESTIKAWLNTRQGITRKKENTVRNCIKTILASQEGKAIYPSLETEKRTYIIDDELYNTLTKLGKKKYCSVDHLICNVLLAWVNTQIRSNSLKRMPEYFEELSHVIYEAEQIEDSIASALKEAEKVLYEAKQNLNQLKESENEEPQCNELESALRLAIEETIKRVSENVEKLKELHELAQRHRQLLIAESKSRPLNGLHEMLRRESNRTTIKSHP